MPTKTISYSCDYCDKLFSNERSAVQHEKRCHWNPINKACASCINDYCKGKPVTNCPEYQSREDYINA